MRRLFWAALGAAVGVVVVRKATKAAQACTPKGMARSLTTVGDGVRGFIDDVRAGMAEREVELAEALAEPGDTAQAERLLRNEGVGSDG